MGFKIEEFRKLIDNPNNKPYYWCIKINYEINRTGSKTAKLKWFPVFTVEANGGWNTGTQASFTFLENTYSFKGKDVESIGDGYEDNTNYYIKNSDGIVYNSSNPIENNINTNTNGEIITDLSLNFNVFNKEYTGDKLDIGTVYFSSLKITFKLDKSGANLDWNGVTKPSDSNININEVTYNYSDNDIIGYIPGATIDGYDFKKWSYNDSYYNKNDSLNKNLLKTTNAITLTAIWESKNLNVTYKFKEESIYTTNYSMPDNARILGFNVLCNSTSKINSIESDTGYEHSCSYQDKKYIILGWKDENNKYYNFGELINSETSSVTLTAIAYMLYSIEYNLEPRGSFEGYRNIIYSSGSDTLLASPNYHFYDSKNLFKEIKEHNLENIKFNNEELTGRAFRVYNPKQSGYKFKGWLIEGINGGDKVCWSGDGENGLLSPLSYNGDFNKVTIDVQAYNPLYFSDLKSDGGMVKFTAIWELGISSAKLNDRDFIIYWKYDANAKNDDIKFYKSPEFSESNVINNVTIIQESGKSFNGYYTNNFNNIYIEDSTNSFKEKIRYIDNTGVIQKDLFKITDEIVLYSSYSPQIYTVSFNKNLNETVKNMPSSIEKDYNSNFTYKDLKELKNPYSANYKFLGWSKTSGENNEKLPNGDDNDAIISNHLDTTLYAKWELYPRHWRQVGNSNIYIFTDGNFNN